MDEHLDEIQNIDIDYLKNGHEIFECSNCQFTSNDTEVIQNHLSEHVLRPKESNEVRENERNRLKALMNSKNWRDAYDDDGNPLLSSSESEYSDESSNESLDDEA